MAPDAPSSREIIDNAMSGYQDAAILLTAGNLGVFAALADPERPGRPGPALSAGELAAARELDPRALEIVLLALAGAGVLEHADGRFALPPEMAALLDPAGEESLASILDHHFHLMQRWVHLDEVVRTGEPVPRDPGGRSPDQLRAFICGMRDISRRSSVEVADAVDLAGARRLLDLGGGPGTSSLTFARRFPQLECVVFDLPEVVAIAREEIAAAGLADRVGTRAGDYFADDLGSGFDVVYISNIIHSLDPEQTAKLFAKSHAALEPGGRIVVKDFFLEDSRTTPARSARFAVNMLIGTAGGKSYTWSETEALLTDVGFGDFRRHPVATHSGVIEASRGG
jgi:SAM-dependent methyltransferase